MPHGEDDAWGFRVSDRRGRWVASGEHRRPDAGARPARGSGAASEKGGRFLAAQRPVRLPDGVELRPTFSAGLGRVVPGDTMTQILARADALLYEAKREGRARIALDPCDSSRPAEGGEPSPSTMASQRRGSGDTATERSRAVAEYGRQAS